MLNDVGLGVLGTRTVAGWAGGILAAAVAVGAGTTAVVYAQDDEPACASVAGNAATANACADRGAADPLTAATNAAATAATQAAVNELADQVANARTELAAKTEMVKDTLTDAQATLAAVPGTATATAAAAVAALVTGQVLAGPLGLVVSV